MKEAADILSYGGGKQTAAMCVLVAQGKLPRPERAVIADTGRENPATWKYLEEYMRPLLRESVGLEVEVAPRELAKVDIYAKNGDLLLPVFTQTGKLATYCSNEWKQRVVERYLRAQGYGPARPVRMWIGYSTEELHRAKKGNGAGWSERWFPLLLGVPMRRDECVTLVRSAGLPDPPKSRCWMCPHQNAEEWREVRDQTPELFEQAAELDDKIRARDKRGGVFLHASLKPLREVDLDEEANADLFRSPRGCDSGMCFV